MAPGNATKYQCDKEKDATRALIEGEKEENDNAGDQNTKAIVMARYSLIRRLASWKFIFLLLSILATFLLLSVWIISYWRASVIGAYRI